MTFGVSGWKAREAAAGRKQLRWATTDEARAQRGAMMKAKERNAELMRQKDELQRRIELLERTVRAAPPEEELARLTQEADSINAEIDTLADTLNNPPQPQLTDDRAKQARIAKGRADYYLSLAANPNSAALLNYRSLQQNPQPESSVVSEPETQGEEPRPEAKDDESKPKNKRG